ncbi:MAG: NAD(P)-binding protein, partial [Acidimicrobiia bacterium]|nr:NAD(P)-binding protein [Acidimicrobiia bacterium]
MLRAAVEDAAVVALLPTVAHLTGEHDLAADDLRPNPDSLLDPNGGLTEDQIHRGRQRAFEALVRWRDRGCPAPEPLDSTIERQLFAFMVGDANVDAYHELLAEELALDGQDRRAPSWHVDDVAAPTTLRVGIIGAGMSGVLAAHRLRQAGVDVVVWDKNPDVGGTWFDNTYPGCRVDVPNHLYSYSFAQRQWDQHFSTQPELLQYFRDVADETGVRPLVRFGTEVREATWDDDTHEWRVLVASTDSDDPTEERVNVLISAVGQLNRPSFPAMEGRDDFAGASFHSAAWDHDVSLDGARVGVIGTGASAVQFIPHLAEVAAEVTVFQRTPNWLVPTEDYHDEVSAPLHWLGEHLPSYAHWYRLWLFWRLHEGLLVAAQVDPDWEPQERSVSAMNDLVRELLTDYLRQQFADRPDLLDDVLPDYPPIAKRVLRDNGSWAAALSADNVRLVTTPIERIAPEGVVTTDGVRHDLDVVVYGTGFSASAFLTPMRVTGRDGLDLHEHWGGDARAYLGMAVPGFPNLFCLYGPNTNIVINGSIIYFSECEVRYVTECVRLLAERGGGSLECRPEVHDAFTERVDAANRAMVWGAAEVHSWYRNEHGRVAQNWPFSLLEY